MDVPVLIGSTRDDMTLLMVGTPWFGKLDEAGLAGMAQGFFGDMTPELLAAYKAEAPNASPTDIACQIVTDRTMWLGSVEWAERRAAANGAPVYAYRFDYETTAMGGMLGATHGGDIPFAMNNYDASSMAGDRAGNPDMAGTYAGYDGPCPPWNDEIIHHYHFEVHALDVDTLGLEGEFDGNDVRQAMAGHVLASARVTGTYTLNPALRQ